MLPVLRCCLAACVTFAILTGVTGYLPMRSLAALETVPTGREGKCGAVDLVIAIDTTHSMAAAIRDVKREMVHLLDLTQFVSGGDYRLGLVSFKDRVTVEVDLGGTADKSDTAEAISWAIRRLQAEGGNGGPEASDEALHTAVANLTADNRPQDGDFKGVWEARSRILVLVTDNLPGGFDDQFDEGVDDLNARDVTTMALDKDIRISSVYIPTSGFEMSPDPRVEQIMRAYAQLTGGVFAVTQTTGQGAAEAIADIINRCGSRPLS
ncbi:MAG: VWA domain-containing protein [Alphaproteobacteria bacterium]|nr:VWA domain-containing protein [Alphaproteobacteria bacterium]